MSFSGYHFGRPLLGLRSMRSGAFRKFSSSGLGKLKSGSLTSSKLLSQGGLSISRSYTKREGRYKVTGMSFCESSTAWV